MDDKDRTIITFGDDTDDVQDAAAARDTVVLDGDAYKEAMMSGMDISGSDDVNVDVRVVQDTDTQQSQSPDPSDAAQEDFLEDYKTFADNYDERQAASEEARRQARQAAAYQAEYAPAEARREYKQEHNSRYVTRGFLAVCLVITMLVSSVLGAVMGGIFSGRAGSSSSDSRAPREDSELSQLSLSDATGSDMTVSQIVDKNADAVVEILVSGTTQNFFGQMEVTEGAGSGVIVTDNGYIVTNYHVIEGASKVQVTLHNGETYPATIIGGVDENDIAVIKINASGLTVAEIGDSSTVKVGDTAVAIGNPLGQLGGTATTGIISALDRTLTIENRTMTLMQTDAAINGGNSGGGLFNSKGELIGIVDAKSSGIGIEGLAFAIPINTVSDIINDLIENGKVSTRPVVGITIQDVSEANAEYYGLESAGVYVAQVTGENAKKAGFQQGDRIISIDGTKADSSDTFISKVRQHKVGDTVSIVVSRMGQEIEIKTVLEELTVVDDPSSEESGR